MLFKTIYATEHNQFYFRIVVNGKTKCYIWADSKEDAEKQVSHDMLECYGIIDYHVEQVFHSDGTAVRGTDKTIR